MALTKIGIDAGGSLIKIAYMNNDKILYRKFEATDLENVVLWMNNQSPESMICITGGKGSLLQSMLKHERCDKIVEFDATCKGIKYLLNSLGVNLDSFILTNVGTGTSIHFINLESNTRVGGTGVGGGTIIGLSSLLTGIGEYPNIVSQARQGQRNRVDLTVKDIYEGEAPPIFGDLTASNFGKAPFINAPIDKKDMLAAIMGLVGETVATTSMFAAGQFGVSDIVYIGSSFIENDPLQKVVVDYTKFKGANPLFVQNGEYSGAIGALLSI